MAARTCIYSDPKKEGEGPRLYLSANGWIENPQHAIEYFSLSTANRPHQVPIGYQQSQSVLAEAIKVHPAILETRALEKELQELFVQGVITIFPPKENHLSWFLNVKLPPEKRSLVIEYRDRRGYGIQALDGMTNPVGLVLKRQELLLRAIALAEPIICTCECHGPMLGFHHCFGPVCCPEPDASRSNAVKTERDAQV